MSLDTVVSALEGTGSSCEWPSTTRPRGRRSAAGPCHDARTSAASAPGGRDISRGVAPDRPRRSGPWRIAALPGASGGSTGGQPADVVVAPRVLLRPHGEARVVRPRAQLRRIRRLGLDRRRPDLGRRLRSLAPRTPSGPPRDATTCLAPPHTGDRKRTTCSAPAGPATVKHPDVPGKGSCPAFAAARRPSPPRPGHPASRRWPGAPGPQSSWPTNTGSFTSVTPNASLHAVAHLRGPGPPRRLPSRRPGWSPPACAWSTATPGPAGRSPCANPARSISQAALVLTWPSASGEPRRRRRLGPSRVAHALASAAKCRRRQDRVGEERPAAPGVVVGGVEHHAPARALRQHRLAGLGQRHPRRPTSTPSCAARSA